MTENDFVPTIAEAKAPHRPSHQVLAIKREIMTYAGGQAHFIERMDEQARIITEQRELLETLSEKHKKICQEYTRTTIRLSDYKEKKPIHNLSVLQETIDKQMERYEELKAKYSRTAQALGISRRENFILEEHITQLNEQLDNERDRVYRLRKELFRKEKIIKVLNKYNER